MPKLNMRRLGGGDPASAVGEIGGLMGPLGLPSAVAGVMGKATTLTPDDLMELHEMLGKPLTLGKRLLRLSSGDPTKNTVILHDATTGGRIKTAMDDFLQLFRKIGGESENPFPEGSVVSAPGIPAPAAEFGPKGGIPKRSLPGR